MYLRACMSCLCLPPYLSARVFSCRRTAIVNTVVLIRVKENNFIFGGFTGDAAWSSKYKFVRSSNSFVFSLVNAVGGPVRLRCTRPEKAIGCHSSCGPLFGVGPDIHIVGDWTRARGGCSYNSRSLIHHLRPGLRRHARHRLTPRGLV